jgi:diguanylate cyclase (GGDEF)-like protein/PAS domain S-box-containing protein
MNVSKRRVNGMFQENPFSLIDAKAFLNENLLYLSENEKQLRFLIDMIQEFIVVKDGKGRWLVTNKKVLEAYELEGIDYRGKTDLELGIINPKFKEAFEFNATTDEQAWMKGTSLKIEKNIMGQVWEVIKTPFFNETSERHHLVIVSRNITKRKKAEAKLQESEKKYRLITENMKDIIITIDKEGKAQYLSPSFEHILGYSQEEFIGQPLILLLHHDDAKRIHQMIEDMVVNCVPKYKIECRFKKADGEYIWYEAIYSCVHNENGEFDHLIISARDITDRKNNESHLKKLAYQDTLTGAYNRRFLMEKLPEILLQSEISGTKVGLLYFDIDCFKQINDSMGHDIGDQLLIEFVKRVQSNLRFRDPIVRMGGDEFIAIVPNLPSDHYIVPIAYLLCDSLKRPWRINGNTVEATSSFGVAVSPKDGNSLQSLLSNADKALYKAKQKGKSRVEFYKEPMEE